MERQVFLDKLNMELTMKAEEFTIGNMINHDEIRSLYSNFVEERSYYNNEMNLLIRCLKEGDFSFENIYRNYGRAVCVYAIDLAQKSMKLEIDRKFLNRMDENHEACK